MGKNFIEPGGFIHKKILKGKSFKIINTYGQQVVDFWAFNIDNMSEALSMHHSRSALYKLWFEPQDILVSNLFKPILKIVNDTSKGMHDTLHAACSPGSYKFYNEPPPPTNCQDNLQNALSNYSIDPPFILCPWNLFEHAYIKNDNSIIDKPSTAKQGDYIELEAQQSLIIVCSACPSKIGNISGLEPRGATVEY